MVSPGRSPEPIMVGPYRLIQRLGEGGMGVVHLALDPGGRAVAIKVLRPHIAADPDARRRLEREVATLRRVQHPRVAAVIDADVEGDMPYLVTSFVPGKPLDTYIREHGPLPRGHVARVGKVLADALRAIHDAGVVHRDVKPANVMMLDGEPILIDFGIAHVADESRITHTGLVMGTPGYLSPEIIGGDPVSAATDWWGWGATLAYAATGRAPFGTGPIEVVLDRVRRGVSDLDGVDEGLKLTLTQALSVDPARRPPPDALVAGLAAVPPVRPSTAAQRLDVNAPVATGPAIGPQDSTVRVPPPGTPAVPVAPAGAQPASQVQQPVYGDATVRVPPPGPSNSAPGSVPGPVPSWNPEAITERVPPPGGAPVAPAPAAVAAAATQVYAARAGAAAAAQTDVMYPPWQQPAHAPPDPDGWNGSGGGYARDAAVAPDAYAADPYAADPYAPGPPEGTGELPVRRWSAPVDPVTASRGVMLGLLVVLSLVAGVAPQSALIIVWLALTALRVVDHANTSLLLRRQQFGQRGSDPVMIGLSMPWRIVVSALTSLLLLVLPLLIGISVTFIVASATAGGPDRAIPAQPGSLAVGAAAVLLTCWFGPGGGAIRRGSRVAVRGVVRTRRSQLIVWGVLALVVIAALMVISTQASPDWGTWEGTWLVNQLSR